MATTSRWQTMTERNATGSVWRYQTCGLLVESCIALPHLTHITHDTPPDIIIDEGACPQNLEQAHAGGETWQVSATKAILKFPGLLEVLIDGTDRMVFKRVAELTDDAVAALLFGSAWLLLLMRRGDAVVRASVVLNDGKALLFCGRTLTGKSTIAAAMHQTGYPMIGDDLAVLFFDDKRRLMVLPDGARPRLWPGAIAGLELGAYVGKPIRPGLTKRMLHLSPALPAKDVPVAVSEIFVLEQPQPGEAPHLADIALIDRIQFMRALVPRPELIEPLGLVANYLEFSARAAGAVVWRRLRLTPGPDAAREACALLEPNLAISVAQP